MPGSIARRLGLGVVLTLASAGVCAAQDIPDEPDGASAQGLDCTEAEIDYAGDPALTREERIAAMDRALYRSLARYDACRAQAEAAGGGAVAGGGGGVGADGDAGAAGRAGSLASSDMAGEAAGKSAGTREGVDWSAPPTDVEGEGAAPDAPEKTRQTAQRLENGKVPDDIPAADNDSVLEAQIRQAAIDETDPEIKAKLWNEYRKYKGLPQVE